MVNFERKFDRTMIDSATPNEIPKWSQDFAYGCETWATWVNAGLDFGVCSHALAVICLDRCLSESVVHEGVAVADGVPDAVSMPPELRVLEVEHRQVHRLQPGRGAGSRLTGTRAWPPVRRVTWSITLSRADSFSTPAPGWFRLDRPRLRCLLRLPSSPVAQWKRT